MNRSVLGWTRRLIVATALLVAGALLVEAQAPTAARVTKVAGDKHRLALFSDGRVVGWRQFKYGQLGPPDRITSPGMLAPGPVPQDLPGKAIDVAAGDFASYALLDDGSVWAWGRGVSGQLGIGPQPNLPLLPSSTRAFEYRGADRPRRVPLPQAVRIAAAANVAFAVLADGTVRAWGLDEALIGDGRSGQSKGPAFSPVAVAGAAGVVEISASHTHVLALTSDGGVLAWGSNTSGALGREPMQEPPLDRAAPVPGLTNVVAVVAADHVSTALKKDGTVWVWGSNSQGQFGNGVFTSSNAKGNTTEPQLVAGVVNVTAIAGGLTGRHTMARLKDGLLRGWGNTDWGQIGAGVSGTYQPRPVTPRITGVQAVFAVGNNTYAVKTDGSVWAWGNGDRGDWPFATATKVPTTVDLK